MLIQRGVTAVSGTTDTITLDTPVIVGESFVIHSNTSGRNNSDENCIQVYLDGVIGGEYTELSFLRNSDGGTNTVYWEVVTGEEFTVQSGVQNMNSGEQTDNVSLSNIDTTKCFPIISHSTTDSGGINLSLKAEITSSTNLQLSKLAFSGSFQVQWQVVESNLFNVKKYTGSHTGSSTTVTIDSVDKDKSFVYPTWNNFQGDRQFQYTWYELVSNDSVEITTQSSVGSAYEYVIYVVELSEGRTIMGGKTDINDVDISANSVDKERSIMLTHAYGNFAGNRGRVGHQIHDDNTLKFYRASPLNWEGFGYQVVEFSGDTQQNTGNFLAFM